MKRSLALRASLAGLLILSSNGARADGTTRAFAWAHSVEQTSMNDAMRYAFTDYRFRANARTSAGGELALSRREGVFNSRDRQGIVTMASGDDWLLAAQVDGGLSRGGTSGMIEMTSMSGNGRVRDLAIYVPESRDAAAKLEVITAPKSEVSGLGLELERDLTLARRLDTPRGTLYVGESFNVATIDGNLTRVTTAAVTETRYFSAAANLRSDRSVRVSLTVVEDDMRIGARTYRNGEKIEGDVVLPAGVQGPIVRFRVNSSGTKVELFTANGQQVDMAMRPNPAHREQMTFEQSGAPRRYDPIYNGAIVRTTSSPRVEGVAGQDAARGMQVWTREPSPPRATDAAD